MRNVIILGAQWGDEGKGKMVDLFSERFDLVVRYRTLDCSEWWCGMEVVFNAVNILDRAPPFVNSVYGYDVGNAQPLGRVMGASLRKRW